MLERIISQLQRLYAQVDREVMRSRSTCWLTHGAAPALLIVPLALAVDAISW